MLFRSNKIDNPSRKMESELKRRVSDVETKMILPIQCKKEELLTKNKKLQEEIPQLEAQSVTQQRHVDVLKRTIDELFQLKRVETPLIGELRKVFGEISQPYEVMLKILLDKKENLQKNIEIIADCDLRLSVINQVLGHFEPEYDEDDI
jgi:hypothetical protein